MRRLAREFGHTWGPTWAPVYLPFLDPFSAKKCLFPRFWAISRQKPEKNCNFCAQLRCAYMSANVPWFPPKSANFLYFEPKMAPKLKKIAIFVQLYFPAYLPLFSHFSQLFNRDCIGDSKKMSIFWKKCQFLCNLISAANLHMSHVFGMLQYKSYWNVPRNWKKLQFLCTSYFRWCGAYVPWFCPKTLNFLYFEQFSQKKFNFLQFLCTSHLVHISRICAIKWPIYSVIVLEIPKKCQFFAIFCTSVMSHYLPCFWRKSAYFLGFQHFSWKNFKKIAIFVHITFLCECPHMSHFLTIFNRLCIENSKKSAIFVHMWNQMDLRISPIFHPLYSVNVLESWKKLQFLCNFLRGHICRICPIFCHDFSPKVLIS